MVWQHTEGPTYLVSYKEHSLGESCPSVVMQFNWIDIPQLQPTGQFLLRIMISNKKHYNCMLTIDYLEK